MGIYVMWEIYRKLESECYGLLYILEQTNWDSYTSSEAR